MSFFRNNLFFRHQKPMAKRNSWKNSAPCERRYPGTPRTESLGIRSVVAWWQHIKRDWCDLRMLQYALWVTTTIPTSKTAPFFEDSTSTRSRDFVPNLSMTAFSKPRNRLCWPPTQMARASEGEADWISIARHQVWGEFSLTRSIQLNGPMEFDRVDW